MTASHHSNQMHDSQAVRLPFLETAIAYFRLSQTQRRLAHIARREAVAWDVSGDFRRYAAAALEARRLWREAKWHLERAKMNRERAFR